MKVVIFKDKWGGLTTFDVTDWAYDKYDCIQEWCQPTEALIDYICEVTGRYIPYSCEHEAYYADTENLGGDLYPQNVNRLGEADKVVHDTLNSICSV